MIKCGECNFETQHNNQLEKHKKNTHIISKFPCEKCSYRAIHTNDLRRHHTTMHENQVKPSNPQNKCNLCSYQAIHERDLKRHQSTMHGTKLSCSKCEFETESVSFLRTHMSSYTHSRTVFAARNSINNSTFRKNSLNSKPQPTYAQIVTTDSSPPVPDPSPQASTLLYCHGPCSSVEKTFIHQDELELHIEYYHTEETQ